MASAQQQEPEQPQSPQPLTQVEDAEEEWRQQQWGPTERAWAEEQRRLRRRLITTDALGFAWPPVPAAGAPAAPIDASVSAAAGPSASPLPPLTLVGGVDLSFFGVDGACAALVVCAYPPAADGSMRVVYARFEMVQLTEPYVPGFLAFREVGFHLRLLDQLRATQPQLMPQLILVDGNGILHPRGFGIAAHLGVLADIPTIGVAKNLHMVDGLERDAVHAQATATLRHGGDRFPLVGRSGAVWGACMRSTAASSNPIFVSIGHRISLDTAAAVVHACCQHRIPTPVRLADLRSRECIRQLEAARAATASSLAAPVVAAVEGVHAADGDSIAAASSSVSSTNAQDVERQPAVLSFSVTPHDHQPAATSVDTLT